MRMDKLKRKGRVTVKKKSSPVERERELKNIYSRL